MVRFGLQEPCNDPKYVCYLWVLHESDEEEETCLPFATMYGILYKKEMIIANCGRFYKVSFVPFCGNHYTRLSRGSSVLISVERLPQNYENCRQRFEMDIDMERSMSGRCIACNVVSNTASNMLRHKSVKSMYILQFLSPSKRRNASPSVNTRPSSSYVCRIQRSA